MTQVPITDVASQVRVDNLYLNVKESPIEVEVTVPPAEVIREPILIKFKAGASKTTAPAVSQTTINISP